MSQETHYIRLQTIGRRSGQKHQVLLRFVVVGDKIVVFPFNVGNQDWLLNLGANPEVKLFSGNGYFSGTARVREISGLSDPILSVFTRKYGRETVNRWYLGQHTYVELQVRKLGSIDIDQLIYDDLETAFDGVAEHYDTHIFGNPINTWLRNVSVCVMKTLFKPGSTVLEIGCGTGTETLSLAKHGVTVIATDISGRMLEVLQRKAIKERLQDRVITIHCRSPDLAEKVRALGFNLLDGAYSTYGAINTEPKLSDLIMNVRSLLKQDAPLLLGVWNKYCLYEILGYLLRLRPSMAFARLRNPVPIGKSRFCVASNAFSVESLDKSVRPYFKRKSVFGVVILLPPSNLTRFLPRGAWLRYSKRLDIQIGRAFPFNRLGDHFLAVYTPSGDNRSSG